MAKKIPKSDLQNLPPSAAEFIKLVIKKMRYRKKVRADVMTELSAHFQDELKDCKTAEEKEQTAQQLIRDFGNPKLLARLLRRAKKRCRPLWRTIAARTLQTTALVTLCLALYIVWFFSGKPVITTDYIAELNRIAKPSANETLNAAPFYDKAASLWVEKPVEPGNLLFTLDVWPSDLNEVQINAIENRIKVNQACFEQIKLGNEKPYYWRRYESQTEHMMSVGIPLLVEFRRIAKLIALRAKIRAYHGQVRYALDDILTCYSMGMHMKMAPLLIEQLVGFSIERMVTDAACSIFREVNVDGKILADFQYRLEGLIEKENFAVYFDGEKLSLYDEIQRSFTGSHHFGSGHIIPKHIYQLYPEIQVIAARSASDNRADSFKGKKQNWLSKFISNVRHEICEAGGFIYETAGLLKRQGYILFLHPDRKETMTAAQKFYDYWEKIKVKTPAQIRLENINSKKEAEEIVKGNILLDIMAPAFDKIIKLSYQNRAHVQAFLAIVAILRYNQDRGTYPQSLNEVVKAGYLKKLPMDHYSDGPLVYIKTVDGFLLYSVGPNFTDDGGESGRSSSGKPKRWADNGDTVFWPVVR